MNTKRWIALGAAALLLGISLVVNMASLAFSNNWSSSFEEMLAIPESEFTETILEEGNMDEKNCCFNSGWRYSRYRKC